VSLRLDCTGQLCPLPVLELARHIRDVAIGEEIAVVADDPAAATDIAAWCRMRDQDYAGPRPDEGGATAYVVRRRT
jgi:tRNA 2-thiouridine synthesizing protein A